jgi:hypothetical protein
MPGCIGLRIVTSAIVLSALVLTSDSQGQPKPESPSPRDEGQRMVEDAKDIRKLYSEGQHEAVTRRVDDFISRYSLTRDTFRRPLVTDFLQRRE